MLMSALFYISYPSVNVNCTMSTPGSDNKPNTCILESSEVKLQSRFRGCILELGSS